MEWTDLLLDWYDQNKRTLPWRDSGDPYKVWVSEIMLQQTRVAAVIPHYLRFMEALPTIADLAAVDEERLDRLWQGLGYYSRARSLRRAAQLVTENFGGELPHTAAALLTLPGIGAYTAGAIASIAFDERTAAVDGNVLRIYLRLNNDPRDAAEPKLRTEIAFRLTKELPERAGDFNQALMDLGAMVCLPNAEPQCKSCPLRERCLAHAAGTARELPYRRSKQPRRTEERTVLVLRTDKGVLLRCRPKTGLLAGLYELPNELGLLSVEQAVQAMTQLGLRPVSDLRFYKRRHIFTHIEWHMQVYSCDVSGEPKAGLVPSDGSQALPTAFACCL